MAYYQILNTTGREEIAPPTLFGELPFPLAWDEYQWFNEFPKDTYFALWLRNPSEYTGEINLPQGYARYVVSFHYEQIDSNWLFEQAKLIKEPIIVINDGSKYNCPWPDNVYFYNFYSWHIHLQQIMSWFPIRCDRHLTYKVSAVCNRISQSKLLAFTALLENLDRKELLVKLGTWLEEKNVHYRQPTNIRQLDLLSEIFFSKYFGQEIQIDDFKDKTHNFQRINSNPWQPLYLNSAIHLTNESMHYSYMIDAHGSYIRPGPLLSEKTFKCLLAKTPFISIGQFDIYNQLSQLGLKFDYGDINLDWDSDPGNLSRLCSIIDTIINLKNYTIQDIDNMTKESSEYNADLIWSGEFANRCKEHNRLMSNIILREHN